jgi:flagellar export protein FliJ
MASTKNIHRIKRICSIAENKEKTQLSQWQQAKDEVEAGHSRLNQLNDYFQNYTTDPTKTPGVSATLYSNRQLILDLVRGAVIHQKGEIKKSEEIESREYMHLMKLSTEKKTYEKIHENRTKSLTDEERKHESKINQEIMLQMFLRTK